MAVFVANDINILEVSIESAAISEDISLVPRSTWRLLQIMFLY